MLRELGGRMSEEPRWPLMCDCHATCELRRPAHSMTCGTIFVETRMG